MHAKHSFRMHSPSADPPPARGFAHDPVMLEEVVSYVPTEARLFVDCTLGGAGHAEALLLRFPTAELFGCDRDPDALAAAGARLAGFGPRVLIKQIAFSEIARHLLLDSADFMLADLGVSSHQLDEAGRGFSFAHDGPLDMRMDPEGGRPTAAALVNGSRREELLDILRRFGEERFAARIVDAIVAERARAPIVSTAHLAEIVAGVVPARSHRRGFNPATRVFQALRIAVNDELGELERLLDCALPLLRQGGRLAVISFHSLEDRMVKERFRYWESPCRCPPSMPACVCGKVSLGRRLIRKPVVPGSEEASRNPRCRSAKLRVFEKTGAARDAEGPGIRGA